MEQADLLRLDRESVTVWPCIREERLGDWVLRFGGNVYGRSNSVQPYGEPDHDLESSIDLCQSAYKVEGIRPMFRLPDFLGLDALDAALDARGYEIGEPTSVLVGSASGFGLDSDVQFSADYDQAWLLSYMRGSGRGAGRQAAIERLMARVQHPRAFARIELDGEITCNGLGVVHNSVLWLFGIATVLEFRRQGLAARLVKSLVAWGNEHGATRTALQVSNGNVGAVRLYEGMGMTRAYGYHYRRL